MVTSCSSRCSLSEPNELTFVCASPPGEYLARAVQLRWLVSWGRCFFWFIELRDVGFPCMHIHKFTHLRQQTTLIMEHFWIGTISMTNCSRRVHQTQHNRGLKCQTNLCRIDGGRHSQNLSGSNRLSRSVVVRFKSSTTAAQFQPSQLWFLLFIRWRKEASPFPDEVTKSRSTKARCQSQSRSAKESSRWLQCDMMRAHR